MEIDGAMAGLLSDPAVHATAQPAVSSAGQRTVGIVYDAAMEYHVREGTFAVVLCGSLAAQEQLLHAAGDASRLPVFASSSCSVADPGPVHASRAALQAPAGAQTVSAACF